MPNSAYQRKYFYSQNHYCAGNRKHGELPVGVTIQKEGTPYGTIPDLDGKYGLQVSGEVAILKVSYTGSLTISIEVGFSNIYDLILEIDKVGLEGIIVIGYDTQMKKDITSVASSISSDDFEDIPILSFKTAL